MDLSPLNPIEIYSMRILLNTYLVKVLKCKRYKIIDNLVRFSVIPMGHN